MSGLAVRECFSGLTDFIHRKCDDDTERGDFSQKQPSKKITLLHFYPNFIFGTSTPTVIHHGSHFLITSPGERGSSLPLPPTRKKGNLTTSPISLRAAAAMQSGEKKSAGTLCNFSAKWILFNLAAWDGPGPPDNVDGWCFNAAECYFYWTGKTINFYFIGNDCAPCIKKHGGGSAHE